MKQIHSHTSVTKLTKKIVSTIESYEREDAVRYLKQFYDHREDNYSANIDVGYHNKLDKLYFRCLKQIIRALTLNKTTPEYFSLLFESEPLLSEESIVKEFNNIDFLRNVSLETYKIILSNNMLYSIYQTVFSPYECKNAFRDFCAEYENIDEIDGIGFEKVVYTLTFITNSNNLDKFNNLIVENTLSEICLLSLFYSLHRFEKLNFFLHQNNEIIKSYHTDIIDFSSYIKHIEGTEIGNDFIDVIKKYDFTLITSLRYKNKNKNKIYESFSLPDYTFNKKVLYILLNIDCIFFSTFSQLDEDGNEVDYHGNEDDYEDVLYMRSDKTSEFYIKGDVVNIFRTTQLSNFL